MALGPAKTALKAYMEALNLHRREYAPGEDLVAMQDLITDLLELGRLHCMAHSELLDRAGSAYIAGLEDLEQPQ